VVLATGRADSWQNTRSNSIGFLSASQEIAAKNVSKMTYLCPMGCKTLTQSVNLCSFFSSFLDVMKKCKMQRMKYTHYVSFGV